MKRTSLTQYFYNGFSLANQSLGILLIEILLSIPFLVGTNIQGHTIFGNSVLGNSILLISVVFIVTDTGFTLSIPVFLAHKQQKEAFSYKEVFNVVIRNIKQMILPVIACFLLLTALVSISAIILLETKVIDSHGSSAFGKDWHIIPLILVFVLSFLEFTSLFFSLEHNGLFTSMKKSIGAAFKNLRYIALILLVRVVAYYILAFIPMGTLWGDLLRSVLGLYIDFVLIASSLFYYQDVIKYQEIIKEDQVVKTSRGRTVNRRP